MYVFLKKGTWAPIFNSNFAFTGQQLSSALVRFRSLSTASNMTVFPGNAWSWALFICSTFSLCVQSLVAKIPPQSIVLFFVSFSLRKSSSGHLGKVSKIEMFGVLNAVSSANERTVVLKISCNPVAENVATILGKTSWDKTRKGYSLLVLELITLHPPSPTSFNVVSYYSWSTGKGLLNTKTNGREGEGSSLTVN